MHIAVNRFKVKPDEQGAFTQRWLDRDVLLTTVPGFVAFHLLRDPEHDDHILYVSHTVWRSEADFQEWTRSEQFRAAHAGAGSGKPLTIGPPQFEGFTMLQEVLA